MTKDSKLERDIQEWLMIRLRAIPGCVPHNIRGDAYQERGIPDIIMDWKGRFVVIELKADGKKPTPIQHYHLEEHLQTGGLAYVVEGQQGASELFTAIATGVERPWQKNQSTIKYYGTSPSASRRRNSAKKKKS